jgi:RimJ/RimL family protein N-acetyltransferase
VVLRPLEEADVQAMEPWFDDAETRRFVGGPGWLRQMLDLSKTMPGKVDQGRLLRSWPVWTAVVDCDVVGYADAGVYDDGTASITVVVAPDRRGQGVGRAILRQLAARPEVAQLYLEASVHSENVPSLRFCKAVGFERTGRSDGDDMEILGLRPAQE